MGVCFIVLLYLQMQYANRMIALRQEQFDESVFRSLDHASRNLERSETLDYLQELMLLYGDTLDSYNTPIMTDVTQSGMREFQKRIRNAYVYEREVLDEVVLRVLYAASEKDFGERLDTDYLEKELEANLRFNGIEVPFHYRIFSSDGVELYRCADYNPQGEEYSYKQTLFRNDPTGKMGIVSVHFPEQNKYINGVADMVVLAMIFTLILFVAFLITVYLIVRQRKVSEIKNDFIHNMTHEFKTPISTISIAAQMLSDKTIQKPAEMYERLSGVIFAETKRLRFQVEKVLQMSLYEGGNIALKIQPMDLNLLIESVVDTFSLKVVQNGGSIDTHLNASKAMADVDEMHFTNVIFNLMDNAVKYKRNDVPLHLEISTANTGDYLCIEVKDNGIGISKENLKRIFDKFYRVHTGDKHDVKGFGLGLAYVHKMVMLMHGNIKANSVMGRGTTFVINMPVSK